jgi:hypothetical protein
MGFQYAGNLGGAGSPVKRTFQTSTDTIYTGCLVQGDLDGAGGGHVQIADAAGELADSMDLMPFGFVTGVKRGKSDITHTAAVSGTAQYGDTRTAITTLADVLANGGPPEVEVCYIIPMVTMVRVPLFNATWGTALTVLTETTGDATGLTVTHAGEAITNIAAGFATVYCRTGANRGHYRVLTTTNTGANTFLIAMPYAIAIGDTFVIASMKLGPMHWNIPAVADCIDGNHALADSFDGFCHDLNLEESGKEYCVFTLNVMKHSYTT